MTVDDRRTGTWITRADGRITSVQVRRCRLSVVGGDDAGNHVETELPLIRVGAHRANDLVLADKRVSRFHFEIRLEHAGYRLRDLDSTNGTFVAGHRVRDIYLSPGSAVYVGDSRIRFEPQPESACVELSDKERFAGMVGRSVAMRALFAQLERVAPADASVLITGETGTGKELVAEALHEHSTRTSGPFEVLDCGSLPPNLVESELFGHEKGAFTGAHTGHAGIFERASGGTVFLDEVGEIPIELQPKLLGVLERRAVRRVGGTRTIPVDIRVLAATNRNLGVEMNHQRFREDLFYRLAVVRVHVPPLRERLEDVPALIDHFIRLCPGGDQVALQQETIDTLCRHDYPGNVRELRNLIERAVIMASGVPEGSLLGPGADPMAPEASSPAGDGPRRGELLETPIDAEVPFKQAKGQMVAEFERRYLRQLLKKHKGNVSRAARAAGLDRMTVHKMLSRRGVAYVRGRGRDDD